MHEADECRLGLITFLKSVRFFIIFLEIGHSAIPARSACLLNEWQQTGRHRLIPVIHAVVMVARKPTLLGKLRSAKFWKK